MKEKAPVLVFLVLLLALLIVVGLGEKGKEKTPAPIETGKIDLPVPLSNRNVTNVYLAYTFFGPVKEAVDQEGGLKVVLDTKESLPEFIATTKETKVLRAGSNANVTPAALSEIKAGIRVSISTTYDLKTKAWITRTIHLVD